jgi:hypothetical protein
MKKISRAAGILAASTLSFIAVSPANAAITGCDGGNSGSATWGDIKLGGFSCVIGDKTYTGFSYSATKVDLVSGVFSGIDDMDTFAFSTIGAQGLTHNLNVQSQNSYQNAEVLLGYTVARNSGTNTFKSYSGNITGDNGTNWGLSIAATNAPGSPSETTGYPSLSQGATTPTVNFTGGTTTSDFANTLLADVNGAGVTQFSNRLLQEAPSSDVPGPLPLLGAGAAFGFSRKLRNRVKLAA